MVRDQAAFSKSGHGRIGRHQAENNLARRFEWPDRNITRVVEAMHAPSYAMALFCFLDCSMKHRLRETFRPVSASVTARFRITCPAGVSLAVRLSVSARNERRVSSSQDLANRYSIAFGPLNWRASASALADRSFALSLTGSPPMALGPDDFRASASALAARSRAAFSSFTRCSAKAI